MHHDTQTGYCNLLGSCGSSRPWWQGHYQHEFPGTGQPLRLCRQGLPVSAPQNQGQDRADDGLCLAPLLPAVPPLRQLRPPETTAGMVNDLCASAIAQVVPADTGERFEAERPHLLARPAPDFDTRYYDVRHVSWDACIDVRGNRYRVPSQCCWQAGVLTTSGSTGCNLNKGYRFAPKPLRTVSCISKQTTPIISGAWVFSRMRF